MTFPLGIKKAAELAYGTNQSVGPYISRLTDNPNHLVASNMVKFALKNINGQILKPLQFY